MFERESEGSSIILVRKVYWKSIDSRSFMDCGECFILIFCVRETAERSRA